MKNRLINNPLFIFIFALLLFSCEKENGTAIDKESISQEKVNFKTISLEATKQFVKNLENSSTNKSQNGLNIIVDESTYRQVDIEGSNQKINIVEVNTRFKTLNSAIFQIEINGSVQTVLQHEIPDVSNKNNTAAYSGYVYMTNIQGVVLSSSLYSGGIIDAIYLDPCWSLDCGPLTLDEVVVTGMPSHYQPTSASFMGGSFSNGFRYYNRYHSMGAAYARHYANIMLDNIIKEKLDDIGPKPVKEYSDKCKGLKEAWEKYPKNEVAGFITKDGKLLITDIGGYDNAMNWNTHRRNGQDYYLYNASEGPLSLNYEGQIRSYGYILIPVTAAFHTHAPCRDRGVDGISGTVSPKDQRHHPVTQI